MKNNLALRKKEGKEGRFKFDLEKPIWFRTWPHPKKKKSEVLIKIGSIDDWI